MLATVLGTSHAVAALVGTVNVDAQAASLFLLGMWWWTCGKMWVEAATLPRALGIATMLGAPLVLVGSFVAASNAPLTAFGMPELSVWEATRAALAAWLAALAAALWRAAYAADPPPR